MEYLAPIVMCIVFLAVCAFAGIAILYISERLTVRALLASPVLDIDSAAALFALRFGTKHLYLSRWFPVRSSRGTLYTEVPLILVFGRTIFVITVFPIEGIIHNTEEEIWRVSLPSKNGRQKTLTVKNPIHAAVRQADAVRALLAVAKLPFPVSVEPITVLTAKQHKLEDPEQEGIDILPKVLEHIHAFAPKNKTVFERMKRDSDIVFRVFSRYTCSRRAAVFKNQRAAEQMKPRSHPHKPRTKQQVHTNTKTVQTKSNAMRQNKK